MNTPEPRLLTAKDIAKRLAVSTRHVHRLGLNPIRLGPRCIRYREADLEALLNARS